MSDCLWTCGNQQRKVRPSEGRGQSGGSAGHASCNTASRLNLIWTRLKLNFDHVWAVELIQYLSHFIFRFVTPMHSSGFALINVELAHAGEMRASSLCSEGSFGTRKSFSVGCCVPSLAWPRGGREVLEVL